MKLKYINYEFKDTSSKTNQNDYNPKKIKKKKIKENGLDVFIDFLNDCKNSQKKLIHFHKGKKLSLAYCNN